MKRVIASILSIIMLFSLITVNVDIVYAEQNESNLTELIDNNGDLVKIEQIYSYYRQTNSNVYAFDIYKNSIFDHQMYIDWDDNNIIFTYAKDVYKRQVLLLVSFGRVICGILKSSRHSRDQPLCSAVCRKSVASANGHVSTSMAFTSLAIKNS